jgi:ABC-type glycerol-3-phosphate transport system substrate-binding protein
MNQFARILILILSVILPACTVTPTPGGSQSTPIPQETLDASTLAPTSTPGETQRQTTLTLWVAPIFSPSVEGAAAELLAERLAAFEAAHEDVEIDVRVKPVSGQGNLIETLEAATAAAPEALPDLIGLNPAGLYTAALKGWVVDLGSIMTEFTDPNWFEHAAAAAQIDGEYFGVPFASQAEIFIFRNEGYLQAPQVWNDLLNTSSTFLFPAGDREAGLTLSYYIRLGGELYNEEGRPTLDASLVASVLELYALAQASALLPAAAAELTSTAETWQDWIDGQADAAVVPLSLALENYNPDSMTASLIPSQSEPGFSLSKTWTWAIATTDPDRQRLALELIDWLSEPEFLGPWTQALHLLPPDSMSLDQWSSGTQKDLVEQIALAAVAYPGPEELATFGPVLYSAVQAVIASDLPPSTAVEEALQLLTP